MKRVRGICLITKDVSRLCTFYEDVLQSNAEGDDTFVTFTTGGAQLSICDEKIMEQMAPNSLTDARGSYFSLEVEVEDVDEEYQRLKTAQVSIVKLPTTQPWGIRSVWFRDPDGNFVNFYASVKKEKSKE